jgi:arsenical pump membrane protein
MAAPWLAGLAVEFLSFQWFFATDLTDLTGIPQPPDPPSIGTARFALTVLGLTPATFAASSFLGIPPLAVALTGTALLAGRALARRQIGPGQVIGAASPLFCLFVLALGVVVAGVTTHGLVRCWVRWHRPLPRCPGCSP